MAVARATPACDRNCPVSRLAVMPPDGRPGCQDGGEACPIHATYLLRFLFLGIFYSDANRICSCRFHPPESALGFITDNVPSIILLCGAPLVAPAMRTNPRRN